METIRVNMTPCEDVQTIHASQNDNEAREWGFELHNNGEKIDSSSISDQLVFKAYEGGTEEILPTNGSTPTTSPFKGDIKYPQGLLSDQEFLYRESPTEEDGLAKITDIKGNTLVWKQLVQNGNFADTSNWVTEYTTFTVSNNVASVVGTRNGNNYIMQNYQGGGIGHKYYFRCDYYTPDAQTETLIAIYTGSVSNRTAFTPTEYGKWLTYEAIINNDATDTTQYQIRLQSRKQGVTNQFRNCMVVDLTQMGLDITDPSDFTSLFPLSYYAYNQGTLLSFNGNGIKTVGKNLVSSYQSNLGVNQYGIALYCEAVMKPNTTYSISFVGQNGLSVYPNENMFTSQSWISMNGQRQTVTLTTKSDISNQHMADGWGIFKKASGSSIPFATAFVDVQIEVGSTASSYEPYTSSTLSLPISTYFPSGMKQAGNVYDELTETKAITRIGSVDLGTLNWSATGTSISGTYRMFSSDLASIINPSASTGSLANAICPKYKIVSPGVSYEDPSNSGLAVGTTGNLFVTDPNYATSSSASAFKTAMSGVYLYYELATPLENYGVVDLGTLNWSMISVSQGTMFRHSLTDMALQTTEPANIICALYPTVKQNVRAEKTISCGINTRNIDIIDSTYSTAEAFKQAMQGVYLLYEKQNPQGFTTASLVTENGEIPLSNEDGVLIGKCTEQLSSESGFFDAKIKLSDTDGECYSNKLQLHIERSPQ